MEKNIGICLFYAFLIVGIVSFPGIFINFWFFHISVPLCALWSIIFVSFLCFRVLINSFTKNNVFETIDAYWNFLGKITIKEKIIISDSLVSPYQLALEPFSSEYCVYIYKRNIVDISVLIITTSMLNTNSLRELFEKVYESDNELIVDSGRVFVFSLGNTESISINDVDLHNNKNVKYYFLRDAGFEKIGVAVHPEYGDGAYSVAIISRNSKHSIIVELIPGSIEKIYSCPSVVPPSQNEESNTQTGQK
jgi:hypothetical protein